MSKPEAREAARAVRRAVPTQEREARAALIRGHVLELPEFRRAQAVGCYVSVGSEVDTRMLLRELFVRGLVVTVPVIEGDRLSFVRLNHPWALAPGALGIPEPRQPWDVISGDSLSMIIVPGLRFGRDGSRLGMGGGHFDRFLEAHPKALRVALAFKEQVVESLPTEPHDQAMDVLVTEEGRMRFGRPAVPSGASS